jgi:predicted RNA-binding Zn-ribbon protein involved in translation (DUF1610 family)
LIYRVKIISIINKGVGTMAYCPNCGEPVRDNQDVCLSCGQELNQYSKKVIVEEGSTIGWGILGFFIPIVGLVLYIMWKETRPNAARTAGVAALVGFIVNIALISML